MVLESFMNIQEQSGAFLWFERSNGHISESFLHCVIIRIVSS